MPNRNSLLFFIGLLLVILSGFLQNTAALDFYGINIDLILVAVLILAFFMTDFWHYLVLALVGALLVKVEPGLDFQTVFLLALFLGAFYFKKYLPWLPIFNAVITLFAGTVLFYLLTDFNFLTTHFGLVFWEIVYNLLSGIILYLILERLLEPHGQS